MLARGGHEGFFFLIKKKHQTFSTLRHPLVTELSQRIENLNTLS